MSKPCPSCSAPMELGSVTIGQTFGGFLLASTAWPYLFFTSPQGGKVRVFGYEDSDAPGWHCPKCGTVVFLGRKEQPIGMYGALKKLWSWGWKGGEGLKGPETKSGVEDERG